MRFQRRLPGLRNASRFCARVIFVLAAACFSTLAQTLDHFDFSTVTSPHQAYVPFRILLTAKSSTGATVRSYTGTVQLTANSAFGPLSVEAFSPLKFTNGQWSGIVAVNEPGADVTLQVRDPGSGRTGTSPLFQMDPAPFRVIDSLPVISLASDLTRGVLYASVGPIAGPVGIIHVIDPSTGNIIDTQQFGGGVGRIELSKDASKLYIVTDDETTVRRLRLPDFSEEAALNMGEAEPGILNRADDLAIHPTNPNIIAITKRWREYSPRFTGLSVFEDTVEKKTPTVFVSAANAVEWGAQPNRLYGLNNEETPAEFIQYEVTPTNITTVASRENTLNPFNGQIQFINGKLYCTTGRFIDPETFTVLGELAGGNSDALMLPLPDRKRIIYFTPSTLGVMLTYDSETQQLLSNDPFPTPRGAGSGVAFWGNNGIAFHDGKRLFLKESPWIPSGPSADIEVSSFASQHTPVAIGVDQLMQATVRNLGPNDAGSVLIKVTGPTDAVLTDGNILEANAETTIAARQITFQLASLAAGESVTVNFTAHSNAAAWEPFSVIATGAGLDPNTVNNAATVILKAAPELKPATSVLVKMASAASAADRTRGTILLASSSTLAPWGSSVTTINPASGEVSQPAFVGPRPSRLAVSDDGKYLYVGFQGVPEIRRFLLPDVKYDLTIPLGYDGWRGPRFAGQIVVRPRHSEDIAATRYNGTPTDIPADKFGFFRNGVEVTPDRGYPDSLQFAGPDRILEHEDSWGVTRFDISEAGLTWISMQRDVEQYGETAFTYDNGKLYFADGQVFDAETAANLGEFFVFGPYNTPPLIDLPSQRALFLQRTPTNHIIAAFDLKNFTQVASNTVPYGLTMIGTPNTFSRWSDDGLMFSGTGGVAIVKTDLVSAPPTELRLTEVRIVGGTVIIRFPNLSPGQYAIEQCDDLGGTWTRLGNSFTETTTDLLLSSSEARKFYRLVQLQ